MPDTTPESLPIYRAIAERVSQMVEEEGGWDGYVAFIAEEPYDDIVSRVEYTTQQTIDADSSLAMFHPLGFFITCLKDKNLPAGDCVVVSAAEFMALRRMGGLRGIAFSESRIQEAVKDEKLRYEDLKKQFDEFYEKWDSSEDDR